MKTHLDLFSGIGGFSIAAQNCGYRTVAFCEKEPYAQQILKERWPGIKTHPNIFTLNGGDYAGVDLLTGGFPCQPFSVAGKRRGSADDRALWPQMLRVIDEARPAWLIGENVAGIVTMELDNILSDLEAIGYAAWPLVIPACAVDARHRRDRVWIVAHADEPGSQGRNGAELRECGGERAAGQSDSPIPDSHPIQTERVTESRRQCCEWLPEPELGRVANGIPHRSHRLRGLGNAIVPQVAEEIIRAITL